MYIPPWAHASSTPHPTSAREYLATGIFSLVVAAGSAFAGYKLITESEHAVYQPHTQPAISAPVMAKASGIFLEATAAAELALSAVCLMRARRRPEDEPAPKI